MFVKSFPLFLLCASLVALGSDAKQHNGRQPVGERAGCASASVPPSSPQAQMRQSVGDRATPSSKVIQQPQSAVVHLGEAPQRAARPQFNISLSCGSQPVQRPVIVARPMPQKIIIDARSSVYSCVALTPYSISKKGEFIQLEDGSQWKVRNRHQKYVKRWNAGDAVVIEASSFFTWSTYKLVNHTRNESADVELIEPLVNGSYSHWIAEIHPFNGYLRLQDGSIWRMSSKELMQWRVNDDVIVALNKDWFSGHYSYMLVNPRVKNRLVATFSF